METLCVSQLMFRHLRLTVLRYVGCLHLHMTAFVSKASEAEGWAGVELIAGGGLPPLH